MQMKTGRVVIAVIVVLLSAGVAAAGAVTLFDAQGEATAYIDTDHGMRIYVWDGTPVAYIEDSSIWAFDGEHLGWFHDGLLRDHDGYTVGGITGSVKIVTKTRPVRGIPQIPPIPSMRKIEPVKPPYREEWSSVPLRIFLLPESE